MRFPMVITAALAMFAAAPAHAQFFLKSPDLRGAPVTGIEPEIVGQLLPGATPDEYRAALVWNMRAALNVAALQCSFSPLLMTADNYRAMLRDHEGELKKSYQTLEGYFKRTAANAKQGQQELDRFGTRIYSGFSTVSAQLIFCQTAGSIGQDAAFTPTGKLFTVAERRMRELRASLVPWGEQQFPSGNRLPDISIPQAFGNPRCWKRDNWDSRRCGPPFLGESRK